MDVAVEQGDKEVPFAQQRIFVTLTEYIPHPSKVRQRLRESI